jgi:hypothetical protein
MTDEREDGGLPTIKKRITDLGKAAYLMMHKHKILGRRDKAWWFEVQEGEESDMFNERCMEYLRSPYHDFDACLMACKKMDEWLPGDA